MNTEPGAPESHTGMLRALPASEPPSALDATILRAARAAPHLRQPSPLRAPARWRRWRDDWRAGWPLASVAATAAAVLFAVHLIYGTQDPDRQVNSMPAQPAIDGAMRAAPPAATTPAAATGGSAGGKVAAAAAEATAATSKAAPDTARAPAPRSATLPGPGRGPASSAATLPPADPPATPSSTAPASARALAAAGSTVRQFEPGLRMPESEAGCERRLSELLAAEHADEALGVLRHCRDRFPQWPIPDRVRQALGSRIPAP